MRCRGISLGSVCGSFALCLAVACGGDDAASGETTEGGSSSSSVTSLGGTGESDSASSGGIKYDISQPESTSGGGGDCYNGGPGGDEPDFSNIWIANSVEGTVSKIDTYTGVELARYTSGPEAAPEPSRTSVNLWGDAVVVNRGGGFLPNEPMTPGSITKVVAREEDCEDRNGNGVIETSKGALEVYPWFQDECVVWNHTMPSTGYQNGPRPVAWEGSLDGQGCANPNPRVWVGWYDPPANTGHFRRLNGTTGNVEDEVAIPWSGLNYGPYGGAVDGEGDFWVIGWQQGPLVRIDGDDLSVESISVPQPPSNQLWTYGMALDQYGNPWVASAGNAAVYDVETKQWTYVDTGNVSMRGVMVSAEDRAYFAVDAGAGLIGGCGLAVFDVVSRQMIAPLAPIAGCITPVGVSIDTDGFVWVVDQAANVAFKISPQNYAVQLTATGLNQPYTYSDMTGAGLKLVTQPPVG